MGYKGVNLMQHPKATVQGMAIVKYVVKLKVQKTGGKI